MQNNSNEGQYFTHADCLSYVVDVLNLEDNDSIFFSHLTASISSEQVKKWYNNSEQSIDVGFVGKLAPTPNKQLNWLRRIIHSIKICLASMTAETEAEMIEKENINNRSKQNEVNDKQPEEGAYRNFVMLTIGLVLDNKSLKKVIPNLINGENDVS